MSFVIILMEKPTGCCGFEQVIFLDCTNIVD